MNTSNVRSENYLRVCLTVLPWLEILGGLFLLSTFLLSAYLGRHPDFTHRYNEVHCVMDGINPYDVAYGAVDSQTYTTVLGPQVSFWKPGLKPVGGYPPWTYTFFFPLAIIPFRLAIAIYEFLELVSLVFLAATGYNLAQKEALSKRSAILLACVPALLAWPLASELTIHNLGIIQVALLILLAHALNNNQENRAGIYLALFAAKPHLAVFVAIPLLLHKKWRTILVAAIICLLASIPPAIVLKTSPTALFLDVIGRHAGHDLGAIALIPTTVGKQMISLLSAQGMVLTMFLVSLLFVTFGNIALFRENNWFVKLLPAVIIAPLWTYFCIHDFSLYSFPLFVGCLIFARYRTDRRNLRPLLAISLLLLLSSTLLIGYPGTSSIANSVGFRLTQSHNPIISSLGLFLVPNGNAQYVIYDFFRVANWVLLICWTAVFYRIRQTPARTIKTSK